MYITHFLNTASQPVVCEPNWHIYVSWLGLLFGIFGLMFYFLEKRFFRHARSKKKKLFLQILSRLFWVFSALFLLYFLKFEYRNTIASCPVIKGMVITSRFLPDTINPLYSSR
jgi:hypothetical protein